MNNQESKSDKPLHIYKASAGSGKTYRLALEYIKLALRNSPNGFSSILAVTFTNKATAEMKERMIKFLLELSRNKDPEMANEIANELGISTDEVCARAKATLVGLFNDYSRFSVTTIDAFFQKVIRSFALELGLQASYKAEIDQKPIITDAIVAMVADINRNPSITNLASRLTKTWMREGENWKFADKIMAFSTHLDRQEFKINQADFETLYSNSKKQDSNFFENLDEQIRSIQDNYIEKVLFIAKNIYKIADKAGLSNDHFKGKGNGLLAYVSNSKKIKDKIKKESLPAVFNPDTDAVFGKNTKVDSQICQQILDQLTDLDVFIQNSQAEFYTAKLINNQIPLLHACIELQHYIKIERDAKNIFLISDSASLLSQLLHKTDVPYLYFKTGQRFNHFLLDEFQDTSYMQWQSFGKLIDNTLGEQNPSMIVGDVKQAIYRWRGGDWNLLLHGVQNQFNYQSEVKNLSSNRRSDERIVDFNNMLFEKMPSLISESMQELYNQRPEFVGAIDNIKNAFEGQSQIPENKNGVGLVEVRWFDKPIKESKKNGAFVPESEFSDSDQETDTNTNRLEALAHLLNELHQNGYKGADIGILTRSALQIDSITSHFQAANSSENKFIFDTQASLKLENATVVRLLVSAFDWLVEPQNSIAKQDFYHNYLVYLLPALHPEFCLDGMQMKQIIEQIKLNQSNILHPFDWQNNEPRTLDLADLGNVPLIEAAEKIANFLCLYQIPTEQAYLLNFLDKILYYTTNFADRISDFMAWWHSYGRQDAAVAQTQTPDSIQLTTIHKAKGLDYKIVIIPFADWEMEPKKYMHWSNAHHNYLNEHPDALPQLADYLKLLPIVPISHSPKMINTLFEPEYITEKIHTRLDSLNLLYVACTRAGHGLYMFCEKPEPLTKETDLIKRSFQTKQINQFIFNALEADTHAPLPDDEGYQYVNCVYRTGTLMPAAETKTKTKEAEATISQLQICTSHDWQSVLSIREQSKQYFAKKANQAQYMGSMIHDILARSRSSDDIETQILHLEFSGELEADELETLRTRTKIITQDKDFMNILAKPCVCEREIVVSNKGSRRPDRIVIEDNHILIIDFKTGEPSPKYDNQLRNYAALLKQIYVGYSMEGLLLYISSDAIVRQKVDLV